MHRLLIGLREIGEVLRRSPRTVQRYIEIHGLPACKLPNGNWCSSTALIDSWIMARGKAQLEMKHGEERTKD